MDVGATVRRARSEKRLTLDQLSRATKISPSKLRALEENDFEHLPAAVYTRGFLRAVAREVGLDPEETVQLYMQQVDEAQAAQLPAPEPAPAEPAPNSVWHHHVAHHRAETAAPPTPLRIQIDLTHLPRPAMTAAAVVLLVAIVAAFVWRGGETDQDIAAAQAAQQNTSPASDRASSANDAAPAANVVFDGLRIELKTTGPCWVSATADRTPVLSRLLQAGESETIEAKDEFVLRVGDPSTINLSVNGEPLRPLGRAGIPVTVQINRQNYRGYLAG